MRAFANLMLSALFVLILLLVLPLIAVFGIPEFVPVGASSSPDNFSPPRPLPGPVGIGESAGFRPNDLFAKFDDGGHGEDFDTRHALERETAVADVAGDGPLEGWEFDDSGRAKPAARTAPRFDDPFDERPARTASAERTEPAFRREASASRHITTWRDAVERLRKLGIEDYHLTPGRGDDFHFSCSYAPKDSPRIVHRFEAEASEPLAAVRQVLGQIDSWSSQQR